MKIIALIFSVLSLTTTSYSETKKNVDRSPPDFALLSNPEEKSAITVHCQMTKDENEADCDFAQMSVRQPPEDNPNTVDEQNKYLEEQIKNLSHEELAKEIDTICAAADNWVKESSRPMANERKPYYQWRIESKKKICACRMQNKDIVRQCLIDSMTYADKDEPKPCEFSTITFSARFKRVSDKKWIYNPGPTGICNLVTVITLEGESARLVTTEDRNLWTYTQTRVSSDKEPQICAGFASQLNKPSVFTWKEISTIALNCKSVKLTTE
jgi:hypothetical protein